ncbi:type III secretion system inner membrane ring lipoprotein SctJ [Paraburkholderia bannensis]|uniref:type III secretion system inner membrane ring lipoprotein SctJ n=1 Tax=Paraburkholderia bannensis TaxID=765414 RepID=UPI002AC36D3D|nr:type III secretion inner membrane ring lipoprotein SctJ [Paraburkholderia bannensis]
MRRMLSILPLVLLTACKTSLFEGLDEDQANRIVAVLSHHGIGGSKERSADKTWNVYVDESDSVAATELTGAYAMPRGGHTNLGELFRREGLISSPEEDHVRYVYGLTQELAETLEKLDGVLVARVHVVDPPRDPLNGSASLPSASVLLRYRSDYNLEPMRDKIRSLVAGAVDGLTADRVSVTLVPVMPVLTPSEVCAQTGACGPGIETTRDTSTATLVVLALMGIALIVSAWIWASGRRSFPRLGSTTLFRRRGKRQRIPSQMHAAGNASQNVGETEQASAGDPT